MTLPAVPQDAPPDPKRWSALSVTLVAGFMSLLDVSIVSAALPSIQRGLGTSASGVQWIVSGASRRASRPVRSRRRTRR